jgi:hypothetical protein
VKTVFLTNKKQNKQKKKKWSKAIFKVDIEPKNETMYINEAGDFYCFAGGNVWKEHLEQNKFTDEKEKKEPIKNGFLWMKDLFGVLRNEKNNPKSRR